MTCNAQQRLNYVTDTLLPYVVQWESEDSYKLPLPQERGRGGLCPRERGGAARADPTTRANFYEKMIQKSVFNPDECRAKEEEEPHPGRVGASDSLVTKNLGSLESVLKGEESNA